MNPSSLIPPSYLSSVSAWLSTVLPYPITLSIVPGYYDEHLPQTVRRPPGLVTIVFVLALRVEA